MKKLFIAALALASVVACSKDDNATIFDESKKTVELTILNGGGSTRAITDASSDATFECAGVADLTVLFADRAGKVVETRALNAAATKVAGTAGEDGLVPTTYSFHHLPETVQQVAVIALRGNANPGTLDAARAIWTTETPDAEVANIVVYGESGQMSQDGFCKVEGDTEYPLFKGAVRVAPAHTRFEVLSFQCTDLGENEYGYSKITLNSMKVVDTNYSQTLNKVLASKDDVATANGENESGKAWSWNWMATSTDFSNAPVFAAAPVAAKELEVAMTVVGKNYTVAIPEKTLSIVGYEKNGEEITEFAPENIYKLTVPFTEANIDTTDAYICVNVDVTIAKWVINTITPVFGTNPPATPAE